MKYRVVLSAIILIVSFVGLTSQLQAQSQTVLCASDDMQRHSCPADTRGGVRLSRQLSDAACTQGSTWGYDASGIWVDQGCRAEFEVSPAVTIYADSQNASQTVSCGSNDMQRHSCPADTRGGVLLSRQLSAAACTQGSTWGYDNNGIWVDKGCRAEFEVAASAAAAPATTAATALGALVIPSGTELPVLTNEAIDSKTATTGQTFSAVVNDDVRNASGVVAIPKGSSAQLIIRKVSGGSVTSASEVVLDVDSVTVAGTQYVVSTTDLQKQGRQGLGANARTALMVGGGAAAGAIVGALVGQGKGAAIGAAVGAAAGAGLEILTKGSQVRVPAETVITFKLDSDLRLEAAK